MKTITIQKLNNLSISEETKSVQQKKGNPLSEKQINKNLKLFTYNNCKVWMKDDRVFQISIFDKSNVSLRNLKIGIKPPFIDENLGELYYDENDEIWLYSRLNGVCLTLVNELVSEICVFKSSANSVE